MSRSGRISQGGDIAPSEELWCMVLQVEDQAYERVTYCPGCGNAIRTRVIASKRRLRIAEREISHRLEELRDTQAASEPGRRHLSLLANPLESLRVRLQATLRSVTERASELGVLLVNYNKPGSAQASQQ